MKKTNQQVQAFNDRLDLVRRRKAAGLSQNGIARIAQVSSFSVARFESGMNLRPLIEKAVRAAYGRIADAADILQGSKHETEADFLRRQTESFLRSNCLGVVEKDGNAHFVLSTERVYEYGRLIMLHCGKNVD